LTEETMGAVTGVVKVLDNGVNRGTFTVTGDVRVWLGSSADTVNVDLKGNSMPGSLYFNLGGGGDRITVTNGALVGNLILLGGAGGADRFTLGGSSNNQSLVVMGDTYVASDGLGQDQLTVNSQVTLRGSLTSLFVNTILVADGSTINFNLTVLGGYQGTSLTLGGTVNGWFGFYGSLQADTVNVQNTASIEG